ncbi:hypothetical protein J19TS2_01930 [Cohnella xylanilytica]|uniref:Glycosyltransferase n=1 Tax=Cohnella xylanilytica TaxID=557555 RepID=A0A841TZK3_9BACL|nr:glycosyltransferase [Cohnella xylanilytica]MBB6692542.1 glycosyltransferase [Cohnella xylanilytica]GIO10638.1 hypothetical protein J19TS2_01930 [Cohnella xylanilytica]
MTAPARPLNILFVSHTYIGGPFVVGSHHLAREMSKMGHRVLHLSTSVTPAHLMKMKEPPIKDRLAQWRNIRKQSGRMIHGVPMSLVPWPLASAIYRRTGINLFVRSIAFPSIRKLLGMYRFSEVDLLLIDQPYFAGIEKQLKAKVVIYRPTDNYADMHGDRTVEIAEKEIISRAHGVVATSEPVLANARRHKSDMPAIVLENGVEFAHFERARPEPDDLKEIPGPRAIYAGAVDERFDMAAVKRLAERSPSLSVVVIGPCDPAFVRTQGFPGNVFFLGAKAYDDLPAYLQHADLALLPLSDHKANLGRSPMKLYEYAAAGLPTVVKETPELRRRGEDFLYFYKDADSFAERVGQVLRKLDRGEIARGRIVEAARKQSWRTKAEQIIDFGGRLSGSRPFQGEPRALTAEKSFSG